MLVWGQQKYRKTIPLDKSNVATFSTTAGCKHFRVFRACLEAIEYDDDREGQYTAFDATLIVDDEDDDHQQRSIDNDDARDDDASIVPIEQPIRPREQLNDGEDDGDGPGTHQQPEITRRRTTSTLRRSKTSLTGS